MLNYNIDIDEFNKVTAEKMGELLQEWSTKLKLVKLNIEKNKEFFEHCNHYLMLVDGIEKSNVNPPKEFFYSMDDDEEDRIEKIESFALTSSFPAYLRKICNDILGDLISKFDKNGDKDKGFNNFIHTFFLNQKVFDYVYENCEEFKNFADSINDVQTLDKFYSAREDKEFQEKANSITANLQLDKVVKDPLFCDVCTIMEGSGIFHKRQMKTGN